MAENKMLRNTQISERKEAMKYWRVLHNKELHVCTLHPIIIWANN
jgi:hypothetical protein